MGDLDNRRRGRQFRELVAMTLRALGVADVEPRQVIRRTVAETLTDDTPTPPDLENLPGGWYVTVHADIEPRVTRLLDAAEMSARLAGAQRAAVITYRRARSAREAIVSMSLDTFSTVLRHDAERFDLIAEHERFSRQQDAAEV